MVGFDSIAQKTKDQSWHAKHATSAAMLSTSQLARRPHALFAI